MKRKYVIIVPDGAADVPIESLGGKTIFEAADIPNMDSLSLKGRIGMIKTIPDGMQPGSDVAQMSLLGYDPKQFYNGRAPIEAVAQNIHLDKDDWVFRCNLVTFSDGNMADHSAGHISTEEGTSLLKQIDKALGAKNTKFYPGVSYRHLCVVNGMSFAGLETQPPHDIIGEPVEKNLPRGENSEYLKEMMAKSQQLFENHEINRVRRDLGENPVSSIWLWGQGQKTVMDSFVEKYNLKGVAITAVDLVRGLAKLVGFDLINVPGATGYADTNYAGKAGAAIKALEDYDLVFVHLEGPDEAGHAGDPETKKLALERIDKYIVSPILNALQNYDYWRMLILPDHPTPVSTQGHTGEPVPFLMAGSGIAGIQNRTFTEQNAMETGLFVQNGCELMEYFLKS